MGGTAKRKLVFIQRWLLKKAWDWERYLGGRGHLLLRSDSCLFIILTISGWEEHLKNIFPNIKVEVAPCTAIFCSGLYRSLPHKPLLQAWQAHSLHLFLLCSLLKGLSHPPTSHNPTSMGVLNFLKRDERNVCLNDNVQMAFWPLQK